MDAYSHMIRMEESVGDAGYDPIVNCRTGPSNEKCGRQVVCGSCSIVD